MYQIASNKVYLDKKTSYERKKYKNLLISNYKVSKHDDLNTLNLKPYEARMYKIN